MKQNYAELFKVGDELVIVNNPDVPSQNGKRGKVIEIITYAYDSTVMRFWLNDDLDGSAEYRRTTFRHLTKLEQIL